MLKDGVKHWRSRVHEPVNVLCSVAVNVGEEEQPLVSLDHETGEVDSTEVILHCSPDRASTGAAPLECLGVRRAPDREINDEVDIELMRAP